MSSARYAVRVLEFARADVRGPEVFWMSHWDDWVTLGFSVVLIQDQTRCILINAGMSRPNVGLDDLWERYYGGRRARMRHGRSVSQQLDDLGVAANDVTDIVLSPFQSYAVADIARYSSATVHLLRSGWAEFQAPSRSYLMDGTQTRQTSVGREVMEHLLFEAWHRINFLEDEDLIAPCVRSLAVGVHHAESLAVSIDTTSGPVVWTDGIFFLENFTRRIPLGITRSLAESSRLQKFLEDSASVVIPAFDATYNESLHDGIVAEVPHGT